MKILISSNIKNYKKADEIFTKIHNASSSPLKNHRVCKNSGIGTHFYNSQEVEKPYDKKIIYLYEYENGNQLCLHSLDSGMAIPKEIDNPDITIFVDDNGIPVISECF